MLQRKYGGAIPEMIKGPGEATPVIPDLSNISNDVVQTVITRKEMISEPGYCMKVRDSCSFPCCQHLHQQAGQHQQQQVIIRYMTKRRRPQQVAPEQAPNGVGGPSPGEQQAMAEAQQRHQEELYRQQQEAERQQQAAEAERQRQAAAAAEAERQRQAAAAASAPPAAPQQKVATFQNLGTDPAMAKAELYYESTRWGPLGHGDPPVAVGSFPGHRWFIVANGCYAKLFTVGEEPQQTFTI